MTVVFVEKSLLALMAFIVVEPFIVVEDEDLWLLLQGTKLVF